MSKIRVTLLDYDFTHQIDPNDHSLGVVCTFILHPENASPYRHETFGIGSQFDKRIKLLQQSGGVTVEEKSFPDPGWREAAVDKALATFDL